MEQTGAALEFSSLTSAISHCAYDKQCSGVYHSCCTERCYLEWNGRFYGHDKKPRLQICPMQSIENLTTGDASTYYQPCTYKKEGRQSRLNTLVILISFEGQYLIIFESMWKYCFVVFQLGNGSAFKVPLTHSAKDETKSDTAIKNRLAMHNNQREASMHKDRKGKNVDQS